MSRAGVCLRLLVSGGMAATLTIVAGAVAPVAEAATTCGVVSVTFLDQELGIAAAQVTASHPASPAGALICSYFGKSGQSANEATINYVPATATAFAAVETSLAKQHVVRPVPGIKGGAYSYLVGNVRFLYVLDGIDQVQMFSTGPLAKLEALARKMTPVT